MGQILHVEFQRYPLKFRTVRLKNSTQNILVIHWKMCILFTGKNVKALRFKSLSAFLKCPQYVNNYLTKITSISVMWNIAQEGVYKISGSLQNIISDYLKHDVNLEDQHVTKYPMLAIFYNLYVKAVFVIRDYWQFTSITCIWECRSYMRLWNRRRPHISHPDGWINYKRY